MHRFVEFWAKGGFNNFIKLHIRMWNIVLGKSKYLPRLRTIMHPTIFSTALPHNIQPTH